MSDARPRSPSITGLALAILFLFPLVWGGWSSVKGQPGSSQATGFGFANYAAMARYGEGIATYLLNTTIVALLTVVGTLLVVSRSAATRSRASTSPARTCCSWPRSRS